MNPSFFQKLLGEWQGTCRTWFEPEKLADQSDVAGEFVSLLDGKFVRHIYTGSMQGKPRHGEDLLGFNSVRQVYQSAWFDSFHMNYALLVSEGPATENGFAVLGYYDIADHPSWGWRTKFQLLSENRLTISAYNIIPDDGTELLAVETQYERANPA